MACLRRKNERSAGPTTDVGDFEEASARRLRSIGESGGYEFSPDEREDVEARIRRMRYGAKKEGSELLSPDEGP